MEDEKEKELDVKALLKEKRERIRTFDDLIGFLKEIDNYNTGYYIAPTAIAQAALAAGWYFSGRFGITGFQADGVMWDFITGWSKTDNRTGLRLFDYDKMLYPQYESEFDITITSDVWRMIQAQAKENLKNKDSACENVRKHWESIASGVVPFGYTVKDI